MALLRAALEHEDLLDVITEGLGDEYRTNLEMVNARDVPITIDELHAKLINPENALYSTNTTIILVTVTANSAQFCLEQNRGGFSGSRGGSSALRDGFCQPHPYLRKSQICGFQGYGANWCHQYQQPATSPQFATQTAP